ncbi:MAG TPA: aminotransferase class I/II-fold pyridoxal phosphate-dependent enzyme [Blastocatellia bacterium]|nr:aminotransferase class I/II-fold pyridoxal phosphate-dependent enzyme [Blastocatellia bacterium]
MKLEQFEMERMQSTWENIVRFNLSESGVHPVAIGELIPDEEARRALLRTELGYSQSNGTVELRRAIAATYPGATEDNVTVTTGTAEANFLVSWMLTEPGDEVVMMMPNYMQLWGLVRSFGADVKPFHLLEDRGWAPGLDELESAVSSKTRLIAVCNPNNPTGAILSEEEMMRIVDAARRAGAWLLADEVYRGAELRRGLTPSFWGRYEKAIITSGLSKAYGLPGLRIGWVVSTSEIAVRAWAYHDYTTIGPGPTSDSLARVALKPENRERLFERTRGIIRSNLPTLREWVDGQGGLFSFRDPEAGAIAYVRYNLDIESIELVERLRKEKSVLIVPGAHFLMGNYLRIGIGDRPEHLRAGLELISSFLAEFSKT